MQDSILNFSEAARELKTSERTLFRLIRQRSIPFLRSDFSVDNPRGILYFSRVRLRDKSSWLGDYSPERDSVKADELLERRLVAQVAELSFKYNQLFSKLLRGEKTMSEDEKEDLEDEMVIIGRQLDPLGEKINKLQKRRLVNFFGKDVVTVFFKDGLFKGEFELLKRSRQHDFYTAQPLDEKAIEAKRMREESEERIAKQRFSQQEKERQKG